MKKLLFLLLATLLATTAFAQTTLLATLNHEGEITSFYGTNALKDAVAKANNGDVITLSSGQFAATDISKAITIHGAGMEVDSERGVLPTFLSGDFKITSPSEATDATLKLEGIYSNFQMTVYNTVRNAQFIKCRFNKVSNVGNDNTKGSETFINCKIFGGLSNSRADIVCLNSFVLNPEIQYNGNFNMQNCMIRYENTTRYPLNNAVICNCIFVVGQKPTAGKGTLDSTNTAFNCLLVGTNAAPEFWEGIRNETNKSIEGYEIFKTFEGYWNDDANFELTDDAAAQYLGTDGTQIGIYGGMLPYDPIPSNPQITKFKVASKSSADGKLSVDIQVGTPE